MAPSTSRSEEIEGFLGGDLRIFTEEQTNSSELSFASSEVSFHSSELLFRPSVRNFRLLPGGSRFPRERLQSVENSELLWRDAIALCSETRPIYSVFVVMRSLRVQGYHAPVRRNATYT